MSQNSPSQDSQLSLKRNHYNVQQEVADLHMCLHQCTQALGLAWYKWNGA